MRLRIALCAVLFSLLFASSTLAHEGHGEVMYVQRVQAGPYLLDVEFNQWPVRAGMHLEAAIIPVGGIEGKSGTVRIIPSPSAAAFTTEDRLATYAGVPDGWAIQIGGVPGGPGSWTWAFEIDGPQGKGTGQMEWEVISPPFFPLWLGWMIGIFPFYGLIWFGVREWRRVRPTAVWD